MQQESLLPKRDSDVSKKAKIRRKLTKQEYSLYELRGELIKKKQILESWMLLYRDYERFDSFKPEKDRFKKSIEIRAKWDIVNNEITQIENQLK